MKATSRFRFKHRPASWMFGVFALLLSSLSLAASGQFPISNADGYLTVGPLENDDDVAAVRFHLDNNGLYYRAEDTASKESLGFIVVTDVYEDKPAASDDLRELAQSGIRDYLYVRRGDYANRISVGVFGDKAAAEKRAASLNNLGFSFSVIERFRTTGAATSIVVREPGLTQGELERVLSGETLEAQPDIDEPVTEPQSQDINEVPVPDIRDGELRVEQDSGGTMIETTESLTDQPGESPQISETTVAETPETTKAAPETQVVRSQPSRQDSGWLWYLFAGVGFIIAAALAYYYLQQRSQQDSGEPGKRSQPAPVAAGSTADQPGVQPAEEPPTQQVINDYAEAVLEGRGNDRSGRSLTILGTDDTSITDLIQDLLLLTRLDEKKEAVEAFAFDSRSLVDNLVTRLSAENQGSSASLKSAPSDDLPLSLSLDATKLSRILSILLQHAIDRTESGLISIHQQYQSSQLTIEIHYHPAGTDIAAELETMTNPAQPNSSLNISERVKFGVANRLASLLDGRLDTSFDAGEAIVRVRLPAIEVQAQQLSLPSGKSIDELLAAEARAEEEIARAEQEAQARVQEAVNRATDIEQNADRSIQQLREELAGISAASEESARNLQASEDAISALRTELQKAVEERDQQLDADRQEKAQALAQLESVNSELEHTKAQLQEEVSAREIAEESAKVRVTELEASLDSTRTSLEQESKVLRAREEAAKAQVDDLESQLTRMQSSMDSESKNALQLLRERITGAESKLSQETEFRVQSETAAQEQIKDLLLQVNDARSIAETATEEKQSLEARLRQTLSELEESRSSLEEKVSRLEQDSEAALADVSRLTAELTKATESLEREKASRLESESEGKVAIQKLEQELNAARENREAEQAAQEERIKKAHEEIESLTASLGDAEAKLQEQLAAQQDSSDKEEVTRLKSELALAQEKLDAETGKRSTAEASAGTQINELIDELNQLRASNSEAISQNKQLEEEKQEQIEQIREELEAASQSLEEERNERSGLQEESERTLAALQQKLTALEEEQSSLVEKAERAEAFGEHQTAMLQEALEDAESAHKLGAAARKVTQHLKSKIKTLETQVEELESREAEVKVVAEEKATPPDEEIPGESPPLELQEQGEIESEPDPEPDAEPEPEPKLALVEPEELPEPEEELPETELELEEPEAENQQAAADGFELSDDMDFSLDDFGESDEPEPDEPEQEELEQEELAADHEDQLELQIEETEEPEEPLSLLDQEPLTLVEEDLSNEAASAQTPVEPEPAPDEVEEETEVAPGITEVAVVEEELDETGEDEEPEYEFQFDDKPIRSSQPVNNPVLHSMIERFVERLLEHINAMEAALAKRDYLELVVSCNWVRGEANTLGFEILVTPVDAIELQLRKKKFSQIITHLSELRNMAERIETKHSAAPDAPIQYIVPMHAKNSVIYENFVSQLGSKLLELEVAAHADNTRQMTQLCRWIDRYGEKIKFLEVLDASARLQEAIETGDPDLIERQLNEFIELYAKIEIIKEGA